MKWIYVRWDIWSTCFACLFLLACCFFLPLSLFLLWSLSFWPYDCFCLLACLRVRLLTRLLLFLFALLRVAFAFFVAFVVAVFFVIGFINMTYQASQRKLCLESKFGACLFCIAGRLGNFFVSFPGCLIKLKCLIKFSAIV